MTKSTITRERIQRIMRAINSEAYDEEEIREWLSSDEIMELSRMALAAMDGEPVGSISIDRLLQLLYQFDGANECAASIGDQEYALECGDVASALRELLSCRSALPVADVVAWSNPNEERKCDIRWRRHDVEPGPLYRHAQPAPVVPDDVLDALQKVARIRLDLNDFDGDRRGIADCLCAAEEALIEVVNRCAAMLAAAPQPQNAPQNIPEIIPDCWCRTCRPVGLNDMRFVVCPDCGNKRCPRANDHRNACTGSNEPGQEGSAYPDTPQEVKP